MYWYDFISNEKVLSFIPVMRNDKWGLVDENLNEIVPPIFDSIPQERCKEFIRFKSDGKIGILNSKAEVVLPNVHDEIEFVKDQKIIITYKGKQGVADYSGKILIPIEYERIYPGQKHFLVTINGKVGLVDEANNSIIPARYSEIVILSSELAIIRNVHRYEGLFDLKNKKVLISPIYRTIGSFSEGYAAVKNDSDKWGYVDYFGKEVIACAYDEVKAFKNGFAAVYVRHEGWGYITKIGIEVTKLIYNTAQMVDENKTAIVSYRGMQGKVYLG